MSGLIYSRTGFLNKTLHIYCFPPLIKSNTCEKFWENYKLYRQQILINLDARETKALKKIVEIVRLWDIPAPPPPPPPPRRPVYTVHFPHQCRHRREWYILDQRGVGGGGGTEFGMGGGRLQYPRFKNLITLSDVSNARVLDYPEIAIYEHAETTLEWALRNNTLWNQRRSMTAGVGGGISAKDGLLHSSGMDSQHSGEDNYCSNNIHKLSRCSPEVHIMRGVATGMQYLSELGYTHKVKIFKIFAISTFFKIFTIFKIFKISTVMTA